MNAYDYRISQGGKPVENLGLSLTTTAAYYRTMRGDNPRIITSVRVLNRDDADTVQISTDGGTNYFGVYPLSDYSKSCDGITEIYIKTAANTATADLFYTVRP